jgi:hypothetical protein
MSPNGQHPYTAAVPRALGEHQSTILRAGPEHPNNLQPEYDGAIVELTHWLEGEEAGRWE